MQVLFLFMVMALAETLEKEWVRAGLKMVTLKQQHTGHVTTANLLGTSVKPSRKALLNILCVLYVDGGAFTFEDRDQLERGISLIYPHFTRFGLEMHIGKEKKASKTECVLFPSPWILRK